MITGGLIDMNTHEQKGPRDWAEEAVRPFTGVSAGIPLQNSWRPGFLLTPETNALPGGLGHDSDWEYRLDAAKLFLCKLEDPKKLLEKSHQNCRKWYSWCQVSLVHAGKFEGFMTCAEPDHFQKALSQEEKENPWSMCRQESCSLKLSPGSTPGDPIMKEIWGLNLGWREGRAGKWQDRCAPERHAESPQGRKCWQTDAIWSVSDGLRWTHPGGWEALLLGGTLDAGARASESSGFRLSGWGCGTVGSVFFLSWVAAVSSCLWHLL